MLELKIDISELDYGSIAQQALPVVLERLRASKGDSKIIQLLQGLGHLPSDAVKMMLSAMPQDTKDAIALAFLNSYKDELAEQINKFAAQKGVQLTIAGIEASKR